MINPIKVGDLYLAQENLRNLMECGLPTRFSPASRASQRKFESESECAYLCETMPYAPSLADSFGSSSVLVNAVLWLQGALLGGLSTSVAVIAVVGVGFRMLSGRTDLRRGAMVILGGFILFGAPRIVAGLQYGMGVTATPGTIEAPAPVITKQPSPKLTAPYDPYAGASVQPR